MHIGGTGLKRLSFQQRQSAERCMGAGQGRWTHEGHGSAMRRVGMRAWWLGACPLTDAGTAQGTSSPQSVTLNYHP